LIQVNATGVWHAQIAARATWKGKDMKTNLLLTAAAVLALSAGGAMAQSQGDWTLGFGIGTVAPKDNNGTLAGNTLTAEEDTQLTLTAEYFIRDNLGIELLAATPFTHDLKLGGNVAGKVKHLPPTVSLNYHVPTGGSLSPFFGVGVNYTTALDVSSPLGKLELEDSWGLALNAGLDYAVSDRGAVRLNLRWMDIDMKAKLNGAPIGTAEIDPLVYSVGYVHRF
jgi:outer membrane protein